MEGKIVGGIEVHCGNCKFWEKFVGRTAVVGFCKRYPPKIFVNGPPSGFSGFRNTTTQFPETHNETWCGEHDK